MPSCMLVVREVIAAAAGHANYSRQSGFRIYVLAFSSRGDGYPRRIFAANFTLEDFNVIGRLRLDPDGISDSFGATFSR